MREIKELYCANLPNDAPTHLRNLVQSQDREGVDIKVLMGIARKLAKQQEFEQNKVQAATATAGLTRCPMLG